VTPVQATGQLNGERPDEAGLSWPKEVLVVRNGGPVPAAEAALPQESPRCRSSQRSSRLLMKELRGLPDFPPAAPGLALPLELRIVAK